ILPLARDRGIGVIVNRPFREGELLRKLERHPLPGWAAEIDCASWAQIILKFIVSHPAVICALPAATPADHVQWLQAEIFGIAPDPTVVATLGVLVAADRTLWELLVVPLPWWVISGGPLCTM